MVKKFVSLIAIAGSVGFFVKTIGLTFQQAMAVAIFLTSILGTLFFWNFRLSFAFAGAVALLATKTIDITHFVSYASLEVIIFLVGMMILVGLLKENGFFSVVTRALLSMKNMTSKKFVIILCLVSAALAAMVDEVTSIIFIVAAVFEICGCLKVKPTVYIIISVLATNIGSSATVLGNPIGILIATKSGLTFEDFLVKALPLSLVCLAATIAICLIWYRKTLKEMDANIEQFKTCEVSIGGKGEPLSKDLKISMAIFAVTLAIIALHHRLEILWDLAPNTILLAMPLLSCSAVFVWKRGDARRYVEKNVEWWTLLFFMFLFAQAGTLKYTGVTDELAKRLISATGNNLNILTGCILWISSLGSAVLDNVVLVASLIPVVQSLKELAVNLKPLWWAILFGGCLGGNITLVGSTANIVALGMLEKEKNIHMTFLKWFGIGLTVGIVTTVMVWGALIFFPLYR